MKLFEIKSSYSNEDKIQNVAICEPRDIRISGEQLMSHAKISDLGMITKMNIY